MGLGLHMAPRTRQKRKRYRILVGLRTESPRGRSSRVPGPLFPGGRSVNALGKATALQLPSQEAHRPLAPLRPLGDRKGTINRWRHHLVSLSHSQSPGLLSLCLHLIALWINTQTNKQTKNPLSSTLHVISNFKTKYHDSNQDKHNFSVCFFKS